ncbi:hypothetical protein OAL62_01710 [bacterium]|nr:hypothetical protein [bacterium]
MNLLPADSVGRVEEFYKQAWKEASDAATSPDHPEFFDILKSLVKDGEFDDHLEIGNKILPNDVGNSKNRSVAVMAKMLAHRQLYFRGITSTLASSLLSQMEKPDKESEIQWPLKGVKFGTQKSLVIKFCWLSFVLGMRSQSQLHHTHYLKTLPKLFKGYQMDRSGSQAEESRAPRSDNAMLKKWTSSIVESFKKATQTYPSKKQLTGLIESQVAAQKGTRLLDWTTVGKDGKRRLRHRKDSSPKGVTITTITDSWLKTFRASGVDIS